MEPWGGLVWLGGAWRPAASSHTSGTTLVERRVLCQLMRNRLTQTWLPGPRRTISRWWSLETCPPHLCFSRVSLCVSFLSTLLISCAAPRSRCGLKSGCAVISPNCEPSDGRNWVLFTSLCRDGCMLSAQEMQVWLLTE